MSHSKLQLRLVTPVKVLFEQEVDGVSLPTSLGEITVLPQHAALVSTLQPGELIVTVANEKFPVAVAGGLVEVYHNNLIVLADSAEHATDIDVAEAEQKAAQLATQLKTEEKLDMTTYSQLEKSLAAERVKVIVANKWRHLRKSA